MTNLERKEILHCLGFPLRWTNWISILLLTANTKISIHGTQGCRIFYGRGLKQGGPLSSILFPLVMECLNAMISKFDD